MAEPCEIHVTASVLGACAYVALNAAGIDRSAAMTIRFGWPLPVFRETARRERWKSGSTPLPRRIIDDLLDSSQSPLRNFEGRLRRSQDVRLVIDTRLLQEPPDLGNRGRSTCPTVRCLRDSDQSRSDSRRIWRMPVTRVESGPKRDLHAPFRSVRVAEWHTAPPGADACIARELAAAWAVANAAPPRRTSCAVAQRWGFDVVRAPLACRSLVRRLWLVPGRRGPRLSTRSR
jgi:hypothetical protein